MIKHQHFTRPDGLPALFYPMPSADGRNRFGYAGTFAYLRDPGLGSMHGNSNLPTTKARPDPAHRAYAERNDCEHNPHCVGLPAEAT